MQYLLIIYVIFSQYLSYNHALAAHETNMISETLEIHMIAPNSKQKLQHIIDILCPRLMLDIFIVHKIYIVHSVDIKF